MQDIAIAQGMAFVGTERKWAAEKRDAEILNFSAVVESLNMMPLDMDLTEWELRMIDGASNFLRKLAQF